MEITYRCTVSFIFEYIYIPCHFLNNKKLAFRDCNNMIFKIVNFNNICFVKSCYFYQIPTNYQFGKQVTDFR